MLAMEAHMVLHGEAKSGRVVVLMFAVCVCRSRSWDWDFTHGSGMGERKDVTMCVMPLQVLALLDEYKFLLFPRLVPSFLPLHHLLDVLSLRAWGLLTTYLGLLVLVTTHEHLVYLENILLKPHYYYLLYLSLSRIM